MLIILTLYVRLATLCAIAQASAMALSTAKRMQRVKMKYNAVREFHRGRINTFFDSMLSTAKKMVLKNFF